MEENLNSENPINVEAELEVLSPILFELRKKYPCDGFITPTAYFQNLSDSVIREAHMQAEIALEVSSDFLENIKNETPFKTPPAYFETLADRVLARAASENETVLPQNIEQPRRAQLKVATRWVMRIAAGLALLSVVWWGFEKARPEQPIADVTNKNRLSDAEFAIFEDSLLLDEALLAQADVKKTTITTPSAISKEKLTPKESTVKPSSLPEKNVLKIDETEVDELEKYINDELGSDDLPLFEDGMDR
jgi:hypothetical protein